MLNESDKCPFNGEPVKLKYGNTNTYLVKNLLIDTDMPGKLPALWRELKKHEISSKQIKYLFVTHYHPDHMGIAGELMQNGVRLIILRHQTEYVHSSDKISAREKGSAFVPIDEKSATVITEKESRMFLAGIGIEGEIVITKSHSPDGAALILDNGCAFVGDLEPREFLDGYDQNTALNKDWETILSHRCKTIYYGHANEQRIEN